MTSRQNAGGLSKPSTTTHLILCKSRTVFTKQFLEPLSNRSPSRFAKVHKCVQTRLAEDTDSLVHKMGSNFKDASGAQLRQVQDKVANGDATTWLLPVYGERKTQFSSKRLIFVSSSCHDLTNSPLVILQREDTEWKIIDREVRFRGNLHETGKFLRSRRRRSCVRCRGG